MSAASSALDMRRRIGRSEYLAAAVVGTSLLAIVADVTPNAASLVAAMPGFMPAFAAAMVTVHLVLAVLLFSEGAISSSAMPVRLGSAYLFSALIMVPYVAATPGALTEAQLIGTPDSGLWLWAFWHAGFALAILHYATSADDDAPRGVIPRALSTTVACVVSLTFVATIGTLVLPRISAGAAFLQTREVALLPLGILLLDAAALVAIVVRFRLRTSQSLWLTIAMLGASVDVWLTFCGGETYALGWYVSRLTSLGTSSVVLVSLFRDITRLYVRILVANRVLERLAHLDALTGLANRRHLDEMLAAEWRRARRNGEPLAVLLIDVDHFKAYNDRYGHQRGDDCLRRIAVALRAAARRGGDLAARYGGEEFAYVLPATDLAGATVVAKQILETVRGIGLSHPDDPSGRITVSIGVASLVPRAEADASALVSAADAALYRAKDAGRDRLCTAPTPLVQGRTPDVRARTAA